MQQPLSPSRLRRRLERARLPGESRRGQAVRYGIPESTLRLVEHTGRLPLGSSGSALAKALGLTA